MLIKGVYSWHIRQPEFIEGGLEIVIFIIIFTIPSSFAFFKSLLTFVRSIFNVSDI